MSLLVRMIIVHLERSIGQLRSGLMVSCHKLHIQELGRVSRSLTKSYLTRKKTSQVALQFCKIKKVVMTNFVAKNAISIRKLNNHLKEVGSGVINLFKASVNL